MVSEEQRKRATMLEDIARDIRLGIVYVELQSTRTLVPKDHPLSPITYWDMTVSTIINIPPVCKHCGKLEKDHFVASGSTAYIPRCTQTVFEAK